MTHSLDLLISQGNHSIIGSFYLPVVMHPTYFAEKNFSVMHGMFPYDYFATKPKVGRVPIYRTDLGLVVLADLISSGSVLFIKEEGDLYTTDPQKGR